MAIGLILAAATVVVTTAGLICGLVELKESERERIKKLFERETGEKWTFGEFRRYGWTGFTHRYLEFVFDVKNLLTTASLEIVLDCVKLDLAEGAKLEEIVFACSWWCPKREVIRAVIEKTGAKIKDVLEYEDKDGTNCLIALFHVLKRHRNEGAGKDPSGTEMAIEVEKSVEYLIELGENEGLEMNKISEKTNKSGQTLFENATFYSPDLALQLLNRGINTKSIDEKFMTPQFKVSRKTKKQ